MFSLSRFILLEKNKWQETRIHLGVMAALTAIIYFICILVDFNNNSDMAVQQTYGHHAVIFVLMLLIMAPCFLEPSINKRNSIFDILLPSTTLEKFLHIWLKYLVVIPVFVWLVMQVLNGLFGLSGVPYLQHLASDTSFVTSVRVDHIGMLCLVQPIFFVGCVCFKSKNLLKSFGVLGVLMLLFVLIVKLFGLMIPEDTKGYAMWNIASYAECNYPLSFADTMLLDAGNILFPILYIISSWVAAYFILREKEV